VKLRFLSFTVVDTGTIAAAFDRFGTDWPKVEIGWPEASSSLAEKIRAGLVVVERSGPGERPAEAGDWLRRAPRALNDLERGRGASRRGSRPMCAGSAISTAFA